MYHYMNINNFKQRLVNLKLVEVIKNIFILFFFLTNIHLE